MIQAGENVSREDVKSFLEETARDGTGNGGLTRVSGRTVTTSNPEYMEELVSHERYVGYTMEISLHSEEGAQINELHGGLRDARDGEEVAEILESWGIEVDRVFA